MMNHVQQRFPEGDCGLAAIATAIDQTYDTVALSVPRDIEFFGLWNVEILRVIQKRTGQSWLIGNFEDSPLAVKSYNFPKHRQILGIRRPEFDNIYHYAVCDGEYFSDPLLPALITLEQARTDYHRDWKIVALISPICI